MADPADMAQQREEILRQEALYRVLGPRPETKIPEPHKAFDQTEKEPE